MDILLRETYSGGDMAIINNDLAAVSNYEGMPYLALYGGDDWFMNDLLIGDITRRFLCTTERACRETTLNSTGRQVIEQAVIADLAYLDQIAGTTWSASVSITGPDSIAIDIYINGEVFRYVWSPAQGVNPDTSVPQGGYVTEDGLYTYVTEDGTAIYTP